MNYIRIFNLLKKILCITLILNLVMSNVIVVKAEEEKQINKMTKATISKNDIIAGYGSSTYLDNNGDVWQWGCENKSKTPKFMLQDVKHISTSSEHFMAIKNDNTLWGWGSNWEYQLGTGDDKDLTTPKQILTNVNKVYAEWGSTFAIKNDKTLWGWGWTFNDNFVSSKPMQIDSNVVDIYYTGTSLLILKADGTLWQFGYTKYEDRWSTENEYTEKPIKIADNVKSIMGYVDGGFIIKNDKTLWAWGDNYWGQLGDGTKIDREKPVYITDNVEAVKGSVSSTFALKTDGSLWAWGENSEGELGDGTTTDSYKPKQILTNVKDFSIPGGTSYYALKKDSTLVGWGPNYDGCLGNGSSSIVKTPTTISTNVKTVETITTGHRAIIKNDNTLWMWGDNSEGQVGVNSTAKYIKTPRQVAENIKKVSTDGYHTLALKKDNKILTWGYNSWGQLGNGTTTKSLSPIKVSISKKSSSDNLIFNSIPLAAIKGLPFIGKMNVNLEISPINTTTEIDRENGTFKCIIGIPDGDIEEDKFEGYYKQLSNLIKTYDANKESGKSFKITNVDKDLKSLITKNSKGVSIFENVSFDMDFMGVVEGTLEPSNSLGGHITKGSLVATTELKEILSKKGTYLATIGFVPIPLWGEISFGVEASSEIAIIDEGNSLSGEMSLAPEGKIKGSVGLPKALSAGAYGKMILDTTISNPDLAYNITLKGKLGVDLEALFVFENNYEWFEDGRGEIVLIDKKPGSKIDTNSLDELNITNDSSFELIDRDYLKEDSSWMGSNLAKSTTNPTKSSNLQTMTLATNIFPNSKPAIAEVNGKKVMVWHRDNESRASIDRTELVFSVFNESSGTWSTPKSINNDGTADFYFDLASDGKELYLVWQNANKKFTSSSTSMETMLGSCEINVAKFNTSSNTFENIKRLTSNNTLDLNPKVAVENGKVLVTWVNNDSNDIFATTGKNKLMVSSYKDGSWKTSGIDEGNIISTSIAYNGNYGYIVYQKDTDGDLNTNNDHEIYYRVINGNTISNPIRLTNNNILDSNPQVYVDNGKVSVFYYSDENIKYISNLPQSTSASIPSSINVFEEKSQITTDNFTIIKNNDSSNIAIAWLDDIDGITEGYVSTFNKTTLKMTSPIKLTYEDDRIKNIHGIYDKNGKIMVVYNKANKVKTTAGDVEYYKNGSSDLCITNITPSENISIDEDSIYYDEKDLLYNYYLNTKFNVTNNGYKPINSFKVKVYNGNPKGSSYEYMDTININKTINPGETEEVSARIYIENDKYHDMYITLETPSGEDFDKNDNTANIQFGYEDLVISDFTEENSTDNKINLQVKVLNESNVKSSGSTVTLRQGSLDGKVIASKKIGTLYMRDEEVLEFTLDKSDLEFDGDISTIYVEVKSDGSEVLTGNNHDLITITDMSKIQIPNTTPVIEANNVSIKLGDKFDPKTYASAFDEEDRYISSKIQVVENNVNTSKAGTYKVTYKVTDSQGASSTKSITVTVENAITNFTVNNIDSTSTAITGEGISGATVSAYVGNTQIGKTTTVNSSGKYTITIPAQKANTSITVKMSKSGYSTLQKTIKVIGISSGSKKMLTTDIYKYDAGKGKHLTYINGKGYSQYNYLNKSEKYAFTPSSWMVAAGLSVSMPTSKNAYTMTIDNNYIQLYNEANDLLNKVKTNKISKDNLEKELKSIESLADNVSEVKSIDDNVILPRASVKKTLTKDIYKYDIGKGKHLTYINGKGYSQYVYLNKSGNYAFTPSSWMVAAGLTVTMPTKSNGYVMKINNPYITKYNNVIKELKTYL